MRLSGQVCPEPASDPDQREAAFSLHRRCPCPAPSLAQQPRARELLDAGCQPPPPLPQDQGCPGPAVATRASGPSIRGP